MLNLKKHTIGLIILIFIVIVLLSLNCLNIPFDKIFISNLLNGLLSNLIILAIATFVIDQLLKNLERNKLKDINKRKSEYVSLLINFFSTKLIKHLDIISENEMVEMNSKYIDFQSTWALDKMVSFGQNSDWNDFLYQKIVNAQDKKKYLVDLQNIIKEGFDQIGKTLKEIYPHPSPDVLVMVDDLYTISTGQLMAITVLVGSKEAVNKKIPEGHKKLDDKTLNVLLKVFLNVKDGGFMGIICDKLTNISIRAKENSLFID